MFSDILMLSLRSSGVTSGGSCQYIKACHIRGSVGSSPRLDSSCESSWSNSSSYPVAVNPVLTWHMSASEMTNCRHGLLCDCSRTLTCCILCHWRNVQHGVTSNSTAHLLRRATHRACVPVGVPFRHPVMAGQTKITWLPFALTAGGAWMWISAGWKRAPWTRMMRIYPVLILR